jgi:tetratricopeptide (TPR) repeat protein
MSRRRRSSAQPGRVLKRKRLYLMIGAAAAVTALAAAVYTVQLSRQVPNLLRLARQAAGNKDHAAAVPLYERYVRFRPEDATGNAELAATYENHARDLSATRPREALQAFNQATASYEAALSIDSARHDDRRNLAKLYLGLQKFTVAQTHIQQLLAEPSLQSDPELWVLLSACERKSPEMAAKHLRKALDTGVADLDTYTRLAYLLRKEVNSPEAHAEADEVMRRLVTKDRPNDLNARLARAKYFAETNRRADAQEDIRHAYEKIPGGADSTDVVLAHAGTVASEDLNEARDILRKGLAAKPDHPQLALGLAEVESRAGNKVEAGRLLHDLTGKLTDADPLLAEAADRLLDLGDAPAAERVAGRLAGPLKPLAGYLTGRAKLVSGDWPAALPLLTQAVTVVATAPDVPRRQATLMKALLALAACHGLANDPARQAEAYSRAVDIDRSSVPAHLGLADALVKLNRTDEANKILAVLAPTSATARASRAKLKLAEAARKPASDLRRFDDFWATVGKAGPYPPEVAPAVANAYVLQGDSDQAVKLLERAVEERPTGPVYVTLAGLKGAKSVEAGLAVLTDAEKALGLSVDLILARAVLMARDPATPPKGIANLAVAGQLPPADRLKLLVGLGELLLARGKGGDGVPLLQTAAREHPFDLGSRLMLFEWAVATGDTKLRDGAVEDVRKLDGADGAITAVVEVSRDLRSTPKPSAAQLRGWGDRLRDAQPKRDYWGRIPYLLGVLARAEGRTDDALDLFQAAIAKGERSEPLVRETVRLLMARDRYPQAMALLADLRAGSGLPAELDRQYQLLEAVASGDPARSLAWVRSKEAAASKNYQDHLLRGLVLAQAGKTDEAQHAFLTAQNLAPYAPEVYVTRVRGLIAAGLSADALRPVIDTAAANLATAKPTGPAAVPLALGQMLELIGDTRRAADEFRKAREADPADVAPARSLFELLRRGNDPAAAPLLEELIRTGKPDVARWARRTRAAQLADRSLQTLPEAIRLIDDNLADRPTLDDQRAKALLLARDPLRRKAAVQEIQDSLTRGPLSPDHSYRLALLYQRAGDPERAEQTLRSATQAGLLANPTHLALLAQLQLARHDPAAARMTVDRIKLLAPGQPVAVLSEARLLADSGREADLATAAKVVLALPVGEPPVARARTLGRELELLGCFPQAEELYAAVANGPDDKPTAHALLAEFLARRGRTMEAVKLTLSKQHDCPPVVTARLLAMALKANPEAGVPPGLKAAWNGAADQAEQFLAAQVVKEPKNADLLVALAEVSDARGKYTAAIDTYRKALDADQKALRPVVQNNLSALRALADRDGTDATLKLINEAIRELGPEPSLLDTRALVQLAAENYPAAVADLDAAAGATASPAFHFHLARTHAKRNAPADRDRALALAKKHGLKKESLHPLEWPEFDRLSK